MREYLIDKAEPSASLNDFLKLAKTVESMVKTETMSRELLANVGKTPIGAVSKRRVSSGSRGSRSHTPFNRSGAPGTKCKKCGRGHPPKKCPAFKERCRRCNGLGHFERCCRTKNPGQPRSDRKQKFNPRSSRKDNFEVSQATGHYQGPVGVPVESDYELQADSVQVIYTNQGPTNIRFEEISNNSQALGDLTLLNKVGKQVKQRFKLDSGACANLLPIGIYSQMFKKQDRDLRSTIDQRIKLIAANNEEIPQLGTVNLKVRVPDKERVCKFYVVPNSCRPIFGLPDLKRMDLVQFKVPVTSYWTDNIAEIQPQRTQNPIDLQSQGLTKEQVLTKYKKVFTGLGRLKVKPVKIHLRPNAQPEQAPIRRVPVAIRQKFKEELQSMVQQKTIRKLDKNVAPPWLNSFVNVGKEDGHLRVCIDPTKLNPHIIRPVCNSYTLDEISYMIKDAKVLTVVDANKGFFQVPLDEESQLLTAMGTPEGIYVFNVLAMGLALASDVFEIIIRDIIKDLKGVINIADDILIFGKDVKEHDENLIALLDKALEVNLTLNPKKLKFKCTSVPFFGNILTDQGIMPDPKKVEAIKQWPVPTCVKDLQSFLGAVNFLGKFIQGLSSLRVSLQGLIKKDSEYLWTATHQHAFDKIKEAICKETLLAYYDKDRPLFIEVDASGQGLGAVLMQGDILESELEHSSQTEGKFLQFRSRLRPIAYASKSLSDAETRYSNIERELLGVVWAVEHFHHYTFANKINIISDHKPLHPLFSGKTLVSCSARTARLLLKVVDKDIRFYYQNGPTMHISDALSRLPTHNTQVGNKDHIQGLKVTISEVSPVMTNVSLDQFKEHTSKDPVMRQLHTYILQGWPSKQTDCIEQLRSYHTFKEEMSVVDGLAFKGQRLVVPETLREKVLAVLHRAHMGITKTIERARQTFFWVGISKDINRVCSTCDTCLRYASKQTKEPIGNVQDISEAWHSCATDLFEFKGCTYIIISCRFSGFMSIREMRNHSTEETIKQCQSIFSELGVPKTLHCDRGANYTSVMFQEFAASLNMSLTFSSSEHHSSNYAERSIRTVKDFMKKSNEWPVCLLEYHLTPIRLQGQDMSPIKLMQKRTIRGILITKQSETDSQDYDRYRDRREEQHKYHKGQELAQLPIGSNVLYYSHVRSQWYPAVIVERFHDRSYKLVSEKGRILCRNRIDLKVYHKEVRIKFDDPKDLPGPVENHSKKPTDRHTTDRHGQKSYFASSHSSQCNSSNFDKSHQQPNSSSQSIPLANNNHHNINRNRHTKQNIASPPSASSLPFHHNGSQSRPPIPKISLKRSTSSPNKYHIVSKRQKYHSKHLQSNSNSNEMKGLKSDPAVMVTRSGRTVNRPRRFQD